MDNRIFNAMEIDAIGEIMNISLGSSATAISNMLDRRVDITTPKISIMDSNKFSIQHLQPAIGVEVKYTSGLTGSNIMILRQSDVNAIVDILLGTETPEDAFTLNDLTVSAVCEVMNQMMGAASTALSDFLGRMINITPPYSFTLDDFEQFKLAHYPPEDGNFVVIRFQLKIEGVLCSEFFNVITVPLARELIGGFGLSDLVDYDPWNDPIAIDDFEIDREGPSPVSQTSGDAPLSAGFPAEPADPGQIPSNAAGAYSAPEPTAENGKLSHEGTEEPMEQNTTFEADTNLDSTESTQTTPERSEAPDNSQDLQSPEQPGEALEEAYAYSDQPAPAYSAYTGDHYPPSTRNPKVIDTHPVHLPQLDLSEQLNQEQAQNLELIMSVPLEVSVEIGRTHRKVQDILALTKGSLIVLDRLAGDQVDLFVNGQCIAKGDVVVVDDNFGIRITEIMKAPSAMDFLNL